MRSLKISALIVLAIGLLSGGRVSDVQAQTGNPYSCFPTCAENDGRFLVVAASNMVTLTGQDLDIRLAVSDGEPTLEVEIFDGDTGSVDGAGAPHWDVGTSPLVYDVYEDGNADGIGDTLVASFDGSAMPDNDWFSSSIPVSAGAQAPSGAYFYVMRVHMPDTTPTGLSAFKVRTRDQVFIKNQPFAFIAGWFQTVAEKEILFPGFPNWTTSTYDGSFTFFIDVRPGQTDLSVWDGDLDRGSITGQDLDTDDPDTPNGSLPVWAVPGTSFEGIASGYKGQTTGNPPDDTLSHITTIVRSPAVYYEIVSPDGQVFTNNNPSGNVEWEQFKISTAPFNPAEMDFSVAELPPGTYRIDLKGMDMQNLNAWYAENTVVCVDASGEPCQVHKPYLIGDYVWWDQDGDATQDASEPALPGVVVELLDVHGDVNATTTTDANGYYHFEVEAGTWSTRVSPDNFNSGGPLDGYYLTTSANELTDTVVNANILTYDYGYNNSLVGAGDLRLGDRVWVDLNEDGLFDPPAAGGAEYGIDGVLMNLYEDIDGDGELDADESTPIAQMTTTSDSGGLSGWYEFTDLGAASYIVRPDASNFEVGGALSAYSPSPTVFPPGLPFPPDQNRGDQYATTLTTTDDPTADFAYVYAGAIGDLVWYDINRNGVQDAGEPGIDGVTVELWRDYDGDEEFDGSVDTYISSQATDGGAYLFEGLSEGNYFVVIPSGDSPSDDVYGTMTVSPPNQGGDDTADSDGILTESGDIVSTMISLDSGDEDLTTDFGFYIGSTLCVYDDGSPDDTGAYISFYVDTIAWTATVRTTLWPSFADTAYGTHSPATGWPGSGRKFQQIVGSDNLQLTLLNGAGNTSLKFTMDLLAEYPSGHYQTAGTGDPAAKKQDDGSMQIGNPAHVLEVRTSPSENWNHGGPDLGWTDTTTSPQPGSEPSWWIWEAWYEATVDLDAFGASGFGTASVTTLHSSPSKTGDNQPTVEPCPPGWEDEFDGGPLGAPPVPGDQPNPEPQPDPLPQCAPCDGKVTQLTLKYLGGGTKNIRVEQKANGRKYNEVFEASVASGDSFTFSGNDKHGTLGTEIRIYVQNKLDTEIHTSCSQAIGPGMVFGSFEVVEGYSRNGGLLCPVNP